MEDSISREQMKLVLLKYIYIYLYMPSIYYKIISVQIALNSYVFKFFPIKLVILSCFFC